MNKICDECETVAHCTKHGCIPKVPTKDAAMKLALEALENSVDLVEEDYANAVNLYGKYPSRAQRLIGMETMRDDHRKAITAMRSALAEQPAQTFPFGVGGGLVAIKTLLSRDPCAHANTAIQMIDAILAEQPAHQCKWPTCQSEEYQQALAEQIKRELVGEQPAQRTWVGLTDEEKYDCLEASDCRDALCATIEAKLKEKNT